MKKNIWKRLLSLALALVLVAGMMPMMSLTAHAAKTVSINPFYATVSAKHNCGSDCGISLAKREAFSDNGGTWTYKIKVTWQCKTCEGLAKDTYFSDIVVTCNDCELGTSATVTKTVGEVTATFVFNKAAGEHRSSEIRTTPATCTATGEKKVTNCRYCGLTKTLETLPIEPNNHKVASEWSWEDGYHYKVCDNGCGAQLEKAACTYSDATCTAPATCSTCNTAYGTTKSHDLKYAVKSGTTNVCEETCTDCDHYATATLTAADKYYRPGVSSAHGTVTYSDDWIGEVDEDYAYAVDKVGTATAKVTLIFFSSPPQIPVTLTCNYQVLPLDIANSYAEYWPHVYSGDALIPVVYYSETGTVFDSTRLTEGTDYTIAWDKTNLTQAGEYTLTVTGINNYTGSFTQKITMAPADLENVSVVNNKAAFDYTGEAQKLDVTPSGKTVDGSEITFTYRVGETGEYVAEPAVTDGGTHTVYWKASAPNHNDVTGSFTVTVNPANGNASVSVADTEYGDPVTPNPVSTTNGTGAVTYQYAVKGTEDYSATVPTTPGEYTVKATFAATTNYKATEATADFTISKRAVTATVTAQNKTYDGTTDASVTATVAGVYGDTFEISGLTGKFSDATAGENKTVTVDSSNASVTGTNVDYYEISFPATTTATIAKAAAPAITFPEVLGDITYGQKLEEAKLSFYTNDYGTFNWNAPTGVPNAGTAGYALDFYPTELALQNYDWKDTGEAQWIAERNALCICPNVTVNKAASTITAAPTPNDLTYNGDYQTLIAPGATNDGTMVYSLEKEGTYTETLPQAMDVDTYTVWYKVDADSNHTDSEPASVTVELKQRPVTVTAVNASKTYGDTDPELTWNVTSGEVLASEPLTGITVSRAEGENAGDYTITVSQTGGANPNYDITFVNGTFTINKAALTVTAEDKTATYGDAVPNYTVTYSGFVNGENEENLSGTLAFDCAYTPSSDKGEYTITPSGYESGHYEITYVSGTLNVKPKELDGSAVSIPVMSLPYTGEAQTVAIVVPEGVTYKLVEGTMTATNAGMYGFTIQFTGNHTGMTSQGWQITAVAPNATAPTANTLTYNGEDQTLIAAGATNDGTMVYSLEKEGTYTTELPKAKTAGTYHVWYKVIGDGNHTDSTPASIEVKIDKADPGIGAVTAGVVNDTLETSAIVLTRENTDVNGNLTVDAGQTLALGDNTIRYTFTPNDTTNYKVVTGEVAVTVADTIAPTGTVTVSTKSWAEFLNSITFGLFFKETQTVSVTASDNLSGVAKIEYIESKTALDLDAAKAATQWTEMKNGSVSVTLEDTKQFVYYIRITDKSGNVAFLSSDGAEYDTTAPMIAGVDNGVTYYTTQNVTVTDKNIATIMLNGEAATGSIALEGNKEATYTIVAADKAGNSTTVTVAMKPIKELAKATENLGDDNVTSADTPALEALVEKLDDLLADGDATDGERETLAQHKDVAESLIQTIEDTAAEQKAVTDKAAEYDDDAVKSTDKAGLEELAGDIDALLDTKNLTQNERADLEALLEDVEDMIDTINATAADSKTATDAVDSCDPATVTSKDKAAIESALEIFEDLLDTEHLTDTERAALEDAKADAEALLEIIEDAAKAADTENTAKVEDVTINNVTPEDKSDLEKAKTDLEDALTDNGGNYTGEEKKAIQDEIHRIEDALEIIGNVEAAEDVISKLPATVEPDDEESVAKIEEAKKAYGELTDYEKSLVDEKVKDKLDKLTAAAVAYDIVKGDGGKWSKDTTSGLTFTANGPISKFVSVEIDGKAINAKHYSAKSGSTIVTLNASYLETLSVGTHAISVVYTDGEAEGTFKVKAKSANPATGDDFNILLWTAILFASVAAMAVLIINRKRFAEYGK